MYTILFLLFFGVNFYCTLHSITECAVFSGAVPQFGKAVEEP
jgi:hypothetical protein